MSLDSVSGTNENSTLNQIRLSDVILDPTAPIVQEEISIDMTPSSWSVSIADLELLIEGSLTNKLMDLETIDEANYSIDKASLRAKRVTGKIQLLLKNLQRYHLSLRALVLIHDAILDLSDVQGPVEFLHRCLKRLVQVIMILL